MFKNELLQIPDILTFAFQMLQLGARAKHYLKQIAAQIFN
jgi:hypothetical protein